MFFKPPHILSRMKIFFAGFIGLICLIDGLEYM